MSQWYIILYRVLLVLLYLFYVMTFLNIGDKSPKYAEDLNNYVRIFIGSVLLVVFNPVFPLQITGFYKEIAFSAGIFLLTSTAFFSYFREKIDEIVDSKLKK